MSKPANTKKHNEIIATNNLLGNYKMEKTIGEGTFGKVKLGTHIPTEEKVAIKILEKDKIQDKDDLERIIREINFLKKLKHPNIIKIHEIIENSLNFYIIMEYASGGELFNHIVKKRRLDEQEAIFFFYQIINGLEHIHKNNIVHRDMKPENLLLSENKLLKIIDFGLSNQYKPGQLLQTPCGSPCYAAPEMILGRKYSGLMVDIWSSGIILYAMICGFLPFEDKNNDKLYKKILECKYEMPDHVSPNCKDLIKKLLTVNPSKRIKLDEIKCHPFLKLGENVFGKDVLDSTLNDKRLIEYVLNQMEDMGFNKSEVKLNIENKKHNNITTTYDLLMNRARAKYDWIVMNYDNNQTQEIDTKPTNDAKKASSEKKKEDIDRNNDRYKENSKDSENKTRDPSVELKSKTRAENISDIIKNIKLENNTNKEEGISSGNNTTENPLEKYNKQVSSLNSPTNITHDQKEKLHQGLTNKINIILKDFNENSNSRQIESSAANAINKENSEDPPNNRQSNKKSTSVSKNYKKEFGKRINPAINIIPLDIKGIIEKNKNDSNNIIVGTPVLTEINRINDKIKMKPLQADVINSTNEGPNFKKKIDTSLTLDTNNQISSFREKGKNIFPKKLNSLIPKNEINLHDNIKSYKRDVSISKDEIQKSSKKDKKNKSVNGISLEYGNSKIIDNDTTANKKSKIISEMKIDSSIYSTVNTNRRTKNISVSDSNSEDKSIFKSFYAPKTSKKTRTPSCKIDILNPTPEKMKPTTISNGSSINPIHKAKDGTSKIGISSCNLNNPDLVIYASIDISKNIPNTTKHKNQINLKNFNTNLDTDNRAFGTSKTNSFKKNNNSGSSSTLIDLSNKSINPVVAASPMAKKAMKFPNLNIPRASNHKSHRLSNLSQKEHLTGRSSDKEKLSKVQIQSSSSKNSVNTNNSNLNHTSTSSIKKTNNISHNLNMMNYHTHNPSEKSTKAPPLNRHKLIKRTSEKSGNPLNTNENLPNDLKNYDSNPTVAYKNKFTAKNSLINDKKINNPISTNDREFIKTNYGSFKKSDDVASITLSLDKVKTIHKNLLNYCKDSNLSFKEINPNKFECKKDKDSISIELVKKNNSNKVMKLHHLNGQESTTKDMIKNIILSIGFS